MWFVFPQIAGLGFSATSRHFAISSLAEARGVPRASGARTAPAECARVVAETEGRTAEEIFGGIDAQKLRSSMTLFSRAAPDEAVFRQVLERFFDGEFDPATDQRLATLIRTTQEPGGVRRCRTTDPRTYSGLMAPALRRLLRSLFVGSQPAGIALVDVTARPTDRPSSTRLLRQIAAEAVILQDQAEEVLRRVRARDALGQVAPRGGPLVHRFFRLRDRLPKHCDDPGDERLRATLDVILHHHAMLVSTSLDLLAYEWRSERVARSVETIGGVRRSRPPTRRGVRGVGARRLVGPLSGRSVRAAARSVWPRSRSGATRSRTSLFSLPISGKPPSTLRSHTTSSSMATENTPPVPGAGRSRRCRW